MSPYPDTGTPQTPRPFPGSPRPFPGSPRPFPGLPPPPGDARVHAHWRLLCTAAPPRCCHSPPRRGQCGLRCPPAPRLPAGWCAHDATEPGRGLAALQAAAPRLLSGRVPCAAVILSERETRTRDSGRTLRGPRQRSAQVGAAPCSPRRGRRALLPGQWPNRLARSSRPCSAEPPAALFRAPSVSCVPVS